MKIGNLCNIFEAKNSIYNSIREDFCNGKKDKLNINTGYLIIQLEEFFKNLFSVCRLEYNQLNNEQSLFFFLENLHLKFNNEIAIEILIDYLIVNSLDVTLIKVLPYLQNKENLEIILSYITIFSLNSKGTRYLILGNVITSLSKIIDESICPLTILKFLNKILKSAERFKISLRNPQLLEISNFHY